MPAAAKTVREHPPTFLPLDPFVVNLADRDADRYAQVGITLELDSPAFADQIKAYMPAIRNAVLMILAQKTSRELLDREGKEQLAAEIQREAVRPMGIVIAAPAATATTAAAGVSATEAGSRAAEIASRPRVPAAHRPNRTRCATCTSRASSFSEHATMNLDKRRAAAPGRPKQGPTLSEGRSPYPASGELQ